MTATEAVIAAVLDSSASPCVTCSFQAEGVVLLHMLRERRPDVPVLFLDTVHHFEETYAYRDMLAQAWDLRLLNLPLGLAINFNVEMLRNGIKRVINTK